MDEQVDPDRFQKKAKQIVVDHYNAIHAGEFLDPSMDSVITLDNVFVVWFSKTLQNWKALVATDIAGDGMYYEVTYNGDRLEAYLDVYAKIANECIPDDATAAIVRRVAPDIPEFRLEQNNQ